MSVGLKSAVLNAPADQPYVFYLDVQWWTDFLGSALMGAYLLPFVLFFMWMFHKARLDRWFVLTAIVATVLSVLVSSAVHEHIWPIFNYFDRFLDMIDVNIFEYFGMPMLVVCLSGAIGFGWWLKRHRRYDPSGVFN